MYNSHFFVRFTRIFDYIHVMVLIFPLIFLISPVNLFSQTTLIVFFSNLLLTAFGYMYNDLEDAEDDYHDLEKRGRNPIASGEVTRGQSYAFNFLLLVVGLSLLLLISVQVFLAGLALALVGFLYSWRRLRLKSMPVLDLVSHVFFLGALQFLITYMSFRPLDWFVIPFLMVIIPSSMINEMLHEMSDFEVDSLTSVNNTIQRFKRSDVDRLMALLVLVSVVGASIIIFSLPLGNGVYNLLLSLLAGFAVIYRLSTRVSSLNY
jgi:4-hydroxybenzoate polyprenyltransferase